MTLPGGEGRDHMDRLLGAFLLIGAARRLAVDDDDFGRRVGQGRDPGDKAPLERLRVERGENIAQMIMGGRALREGAEATQEIELLLAEPRNIGEGFRPGQHGEQAQEQYLVERIDDFPSLMAIRHVLEIAKKNSRLGQSLEVPSARVRRFPPKIESEDSDRFSSDPSCHPVPHPIALVCLAL